MNAGQDRGNFLAEWYGFRVWPDVDDSDVAQRYQMGENCPFITAATGREMPCAKQGRTGICTISSPSNGVRQDWLACPFRVLDTHFTILDAAVRRLFRVAPPDRILLRPVTALEDDAIHLEVSRVLKEEGTRVFIFSQIVSRGVATRRAR